LIEVARRTKKPPKWRPFALETLPAIHSSRVPLSERRFQAVHERDLDTYDAARCALARRVARLGTDALPVRTIPRRNRADGRLLAYGYSEYSQLFNARQLLHLSLLAEAVGEQPADIREPLAIAFSDHLTTNCMMTNYAFGWRRLAPLFSIRAFRHVPRPVELNPWIDGTGRGTYPNAVRQVMRTVSAARAAMEDRRHSTSRSEIVQGDSRRLSVVRSNSVDVILTDPPYFDNIAYSELSDFYIPWLRHFGLIRSEQSASKGMRKSIAARSRRGESVQHYATALRQCFSEMARVLAPSGTAVFTYQHRTPQAWQALLRAITVQRLRVIQVFPILGNSAAGPHVDDGTCQWDAVFVLRSSPAVAPISGQEAVRKATRHWRSHVDNLGTKRKVRFGKTDQASFLWACLAAAGGGMFGNVDRGARRHLLNAIQAVQRSN
jgi:adenine-specific DNA methylase